VKEKHPIGEGKREGGVGEGRGGVREGRGGVGYGRGGEERGGTLTKAAICSRTLAYSALGALTLKL